MFGLSIARQAMLASLRGDFLHDKLSNGRTYKMLTVLDEYTRQALTVTVRIKMGANDVLEVLYPLLLRHGTPEFIRSDDGPESAAEAMQDWLRRVGISPYASIRAHPLSAVLRLPVGQCMGEWLQ
ncbi:MAG: DDE-type integrase/transposase/recombinase [Pseudomonadota bacterium]